MTDVLHAAYDSREQTPLLWCTQHARTPIIYHHAALATFDYCLWRDWQTTDGEIVIPNFAIERKSIEDFIGSWFCAERKRREKEKIRRACAWAPRPIIYVLDGGIEHIAAYAYERFPSGRVNALAVESVIDELRYTGVQIVMAQTRRMAEYIIISLLKRRMAEKTPKYWRELWAENVVGTKHEAHDLALGVLDYRT